MKTFSTTQANNVAVFCGLLSIILAKFNVNIGSEELQTTAGMAIAVVATVLQWIHRYKKGDVTLGGKLK